MVVVNLQDRLPNVLRGTIAAVICKEVKKGEEVVLLTSCWCVFGICNVERRVGLFEEIECVCMY